MLENRVNQESETNRYLKLRVSALESQYNGFVRYCLEMIRFHTEIMQSELKNDPSTPREVLNLVNIHGENLGKSLKLASCHLQDLNQNVHNFSLDSFKTEIELLIKTPYPENHKLSKLETIFCELNLFVSHLCDNSQETSEKLLKRSHSKLERNEKATVQGSQKEKIIKSLKKKIKEQEKIIQDKETMVKKVLNQLEKIQMMQNLSMQKIKSTESLSIFSKDDQKLSKPIQIEVNSPSNHLFHKTIYEKLAFIEKLVKELSEQAAGLKNTKVKQDDFGMIMENFQFQTEEIEKIIDEIVTPRFKNEEIPVQNLKSVSGSIETLNPHAQANEIKMLHGIVLNFKRNLNSLEKEKEDLRNEIKTLRSSLRTASEISTSDGFFKGNKKLTLCKESSFNLQVTYHNENLIRALRKQLKEKEKECHEKEIIFKSFNEKKVFYSRETQTFLFESETSRVFPSKKKELVQEIQFQCIFLPKPYKRDLELENLFKSFREVNQMLGITNKKLALCENEKVNLKQLLKNYENCLDTKEQEINLLLFEKDNWSKINEKNDDFNCGNFNLKQFIGEFLGKFRENCLDFDSEIKNTFESINESINLKIAYFQKLLKIIENLKNSKKIQKNSIELLINRLSETEKMIETLENSLKLNERAIFSYKSQVSQQENEKNMLKEALEKTLQNLHEKSKEIEELRKRKDEKLIQKIEEHDEKVLKLSKILQKYETQEQALNKRILNQSELIENLSENYENVKKTAETYKSELFIYLNSNKTESLEAENKKLQKKLKNLEKNLLKPEKIEKSEESICQRPLSHSQSSIKDEEIRELKEKLNSTSTELFLERQKTMKKKEEYEKLLMEATLFNTTKSRDNY
jgi:hypothetical protein